MAKKNAHHGGTAGLARYLSKTGYCSRSKAVIHILTGEVSVNGTAVTDPGFRVQPGDNVVVAGKLAEPSKMVYIALNKPKGLITTESDEKGRETVFSCLSGKGLPRVHAVGRLDKASEGLLLFTNDTRWSNLLTSPAGGIEKHYHVQLAGLPDAAWMNKCVTGIPDAGELLKAESAGVLRAAEKTHWVKVVLKGGKNRQIRRMAAAGGKEVLRLVRVAIGGIELGALQKGEFRFLADAEVLIIRRRG